MHRRVAKSQVVVVLLLIVFDQVVKTLLLGLPRKQTMRLDEYNARRTVIYISVKARSSELMKTYKGFINDGQAN